MTAMYIKIFLFFHFEVRVANGDCRVVIFARIRLDNLPVHLGYSGSSNGSGVQLQLLKSQWTGRVDMLAFRNVQISECRSKHF